MITNIEKKLSPLWWEEFLKTTNEMSKTAVFKNCISKKETFLMRKYILEILTDIAKLRTTTFGYRVYVDDVLLENNEMVRLYNSPPNQKDTIENWSKRTFGTQKFGIIINQGEKFNLKLSKLIALKLKPLLDKKGMPTEGIIFTLFVGNYDSTPLGIHLDMPGKSVIHFHLGPGNKTMYTWDTNEYENLVGEEKYNNKNIKKYLPYAKKHFFKEGDLYFMPEDIYHIGIQDGLSISVACWCYNRSNYDFALRLQSLFADQYLQNIKGNLKPDNNPIDDVNGAEQTLELYKIPLEFKNLNFKDLMRETYRDHRYSLFSNAGFRTSPPPKNEDIYFEKDWMVQIEKPFEIKYKDSLNEEKLHVFIRGVKIELNNFNCIKSFIDEINTGNSIKIYSLLNLLDNDWNDEIGIYILTLLYKHHGISILN